MLTQISTKGFKDQYFVTNLSGLDILTSKGENGVGKSSVLETALLVAMGYLPNSGSGNTVDSVLQYTTGNKITVSGTFNNGSAHTIERTFFASGKNKRIITVDGEELSYADGQKKIAGLLGFLPMMVDISEFIDMSDNKKKEFILRFSPEGAGWAKEEVMFVCRTKLLSSRMDSGILKGIIAGIAGKKQLKALNCDEAGRLVDTLQNMVEPGHVAAVNNIIEKFNACWNNEFDAQQNICSLIAGLKKERTVFDRKVKENKAGSKKIGEIGENSTEVLCSSIKETKEALTTLRTSLSTVEKQATADSEKRKAVDKRDKRIEQLRLQVVHFEKLNHNPEKEEIEAEINRLRVSSDELVSIDDLKSGLQERRQRLLASQKKHSELYGIVQINDALITAKQGTLTKISKIKSTKLCAFSTDIQCNIDASEIEKTLGDEIVKLKTDNKKTCDFLTTVAEKIKIVKKAITESEKEITAAQKTQKDTDKKLNKLKIECARLDEQEKNRNTNLKDSNEQLSALENEDMAETGLVDPEILTTQQKGLKSQIETKEKEIETLEQRKALLIAEKQVKIDQVRDEIIFTAIKEAIKILGPAGLQGGIMEAVKKPLEDEVNNILKDLNPELKFAIDLSDGFKMGWLKPEGLRTFATINQAHYVIMVVAFLTAIINRINPALKLMCIEAGEIGPKNMIIMLNGLTKMKETGRLDNVLVAHYQTLLDAALPKQWKQHILN